VSVIKYVIKDSIEEKLCKIYNVAQGQGEEGEEKEGRGGVEKKDGDGKRGISLTEILSLFD
jgi:hypothetical protein